MIDKSEQNAGRGRRRRYLFMTPVAASLVSLGICILMVTSLFPFGRVANLPSKEEPPANRPEGESVPLAPTWPPLLNADSGVDSWNLWVVFRQGPQYGGDLNAPAESAAYYDVMSHAFRMSPEALSLLQENGFVALPSPGEHEIDMAYRYYWMNDLPVLITTDTILTVQHLLFDQMLQDLENASLRPMVENMSVGLLGEAAWLRSVLPDSLKDAATNAVVFFAVPNVLLNTSAVVPADAADRVQGIVTKIMAAVEAEPDSLETDWTQYKPRGHYDRTEFLKRYFRAMMWYGRASYDLNETDGIVPASIIAAILDGSPQGSGLWTRVYNATARLVGESDSLNHLDVKRAFLNRLGAFNVSLLADPNNVLALKEEFASDAYYRQRILSAVVYVDIDPEGNNPLYEFPKIYQFMGQRYVIDSEIIQNVMFDRVDLYEGRRRGLPSGLDVAAALGSSRAFNLLSGELAVYNYETQLRQQWSAVSNKSEEFWNRTAYSRQLSGYKEILGPPPEGAPAFAKTRAWASEKVNSALGSWTELKHDTILYAKQPYSIGGSCSTPDGYVEPYPMFFTRIAWLDEEIQWILETHFNASTDPAARFHTVFGEFAAINHRLAEIAQKELDGIDLSEEDVEFIRSIFVNSEQEGCGGPITNYGWLPDILGEANVTERTKDSRIVADVATDPGWPERGEPPRVLHVALGTFRSIAVAYQKPNGTWQLAVGPIYGYYEFALDGYTRLTDDEWKQMLQDDNPAQPPWTAEFLTPA